MGIFCEDQLHTLLRRIAELLVGLPEAELLGCCLLSALAAANLITHDSIVNDTFRQ
jgi:hypothetical protein